MQAPHATLEHNERDFGGHQKVHMPTEMSAAPVVSSQKPGRGAKPLAVSPLESCAVVHVIGPMLLAIGVHAA